MNCIEEYEYELRQYFLDGFHQIMGNIIFGIAVSAGITESDQTRKAINRFTHHEEKGWLKV